jgi:hypothetical protein
MKRNSKNFNLKSKFLEMIPFIQNHFVKNHNDECTFGILSFFTYDTQGLWGSEVVLGDERTD